jgi:hypothetical protein
MPAAQAGKKILRARNRGPFSMVRRQYFGAVGGVLGVLPGSGAGVVGGVVAPVPLVPVVPLVPEDVVGTVVVASLGTIVVVSVFLQAPSMVAKMAAVRMSFDGPGMAFMAWLLVHVYLAVQCTKSTAKIRLGTFWPVR